MSFEGDIIDPSNLDLNGDFDAQIKSILENIRLCKSEVEGLRRLFSDLERTLHIVWPGCTVHPFGSIVTGLGIASSDVDCYVAIPSWLETPGGIYVVEARRAMQRYPNLYEKPFAITQAKVPIVKFFHIPTQRQCDVSFKSPTGVRNSQLLAYLLHHDSRALPLTILLKYWSKVHKLTGTNLMPNYALILLVIFYLQQLHILPSVHMLQRHAQENFVDIWNTGFDPVRQNTRNNDSMYTLLTGFFKFYNSFDFENLVVSPYLGFAVNRTGFKDLTTVPRQLELYIDNIRQGLCKELKIDTPICVQDPFQHDRNCTVAMFPRLSKRTLAYIQEANKICLNNPEENILKLILTTKVEGDIHIAPIKRNKPSFKTRPHQRQGRAIRTLHEIYSRMSRVTKNKGKLRRN